ncbi:MAG: AI-2E family transporter [Gammaproteobacteria bacterium]|nr:MAG: AI-2E family transporter [Gammaproteobacteria bacterium]
MLEFFGRWYRRYFSDPQAVGLALVLIGAAAVVVLLGDSLAPLFAAAVIAYVLEGLVQRLERLKVPRTLAVVLLSGVLLAVFVFAFFGLLPLLARQLARLLGELPELLGRVQNVLLRLHERYPELLSRAQLDAVFDAARGELLALGQAVVSASLSRAVNVVTVLVYIVLVPILVFFLLKDKAAILGWFSRFLPERAELTRRVWHEVDLRIGGYIRGKVIEILIVWAAAYLLFVWPSPDLQYALLLSFLVGVSVIVPYVGAVVVTVPVAAVAFLQWGTGADFWVILIGYLVLQVLDGNVLVPVLFSEVVDLHPVAIIAAILFFGGLWGLWGVFFAIPLATLVDTVIRVWPVDRGQGRLQAAPE